MDKLTFSYIAGDNIKWSAALENRPLALQGMTRRMTLRPSNPILAVVHPKGLKMHVCAKICMEMFTAVLFRIKTK